MKKYILIQNDGEIESNSFELIGASTKRSQEGKIGFFGSGLKYSIAYMMRNKIDFKIFSGEQELSFTTNDEQLKDQCFQRISINGIRTSYTTTMGPTWKEDWFVLREIYCNALDEGACMIVKETEIVSASAGKTRIYIELTEALADVSNSWDNYFADEREPIFFAENIHTSFLGHDDGKYITEQKVSVYKKTRGIMYRKGIRVYDNKHWQFDYNFDRVNINEDRTAKSPNGIQYAILDLAAKFINEDYIKTVLRSGNDERPSDEYLALNCSNPDQWSAEWERFSQENLLVLKDISGKYSEEINSSKKEVFLLPYHFTRELKRNIPNAYVLGMNTVIDGVTGNEVELTKKMQFLLKEVTASLKDMNYEILFDVSAAEFDNDNILGKADTKTKKIIIAAKTFDLGRREIALTLMEENEHLKSSLKDESRAFQTHIFSQWLKSMEDNFGLFL